MDLFHGFNIRELMNIKGKRGYGASMALAQGDRIDTYCIGSGRFGRDFPVTPDMLFQAMKTLGVDKAIYVGDSEVDVITAGNAGMPCISVTWGFRDREELLEAGAKYLCDDAAQLPALAAKIEKEENYVD